MAAGASLAATQSMLAQTVGETASPASHGDEMIETSAETGYAPVNGLEMY